MSTSCANLENIQSFTATLKDILTTIESHKDLLEKFPLQVYYSVVPFLPLCTLRSRLQSHAQSPNPRYRSPRLDRDILPVVDNPERLEVADNKEQQNTNQFESFRNQDIMFSFKNFGSQSSNVKEVLDVIAAISYPYSNGGSAAVTFLRSGDYIPSTLFSIAPNKEIYAVGYTNGSVRVWSCASGWELTKAAALKAGGCVSSVTFSPCSQFLASTGNDRELKLWRILNLSFWRLSPYLIASFQMISSVGPLTCSAFTGDGTHVATASDQGHIWIFSIETKTLVHKVCLSANITCLSIEPSGSYFQIVLGTSVGTVGSFITSNHTAGTSIKIGDNLDERVQATHISPSGQLAYAVGISGRTGLYHCSKSGDSDWNIGFMCASALSQKENGFPVFALHGNVITLVACAMKIPLCIVPKDRLRLSSPLHFHDTAVSILGAPVIATVIDFHDILPGLFESIGEVWTVLEGLGIEHSKSQATAWSLWDDIIADSLLAAEDPLGAIQVDFNTVDPLRISEAKRQAWQIGLGLKLD
jgi:hypothetical protein